MLVGNFVKQEELFVFCFKTAVFDLKYCKSQSFSLKLLYVVMLFVKGGAMTCKNYIYSIHYLHFITIATGIVTVLPMVNFVAIVIVSIVLIIWNMKRKGARPSRYVLCKEQQSKNSWLSQYAGQNCSVSMFYDKKIIKQVKRCKYFLMVLNLIKFHTQKAIFIQITQEKLTLQLTYICGVNHKSTENRNISDEKAMVYIDIAVSCAKKIVMCM